MRKPLRLTSPWIWDEGAAMDPAEREDSDRDRVLSDADQRASDRDQETADLQAAGDVGAAESKRERRFTRAQRADTAAARAQTQTARAETERDRIAGAHARDSAARSRDVASAARDVAAAARDRVAAAGDPGLATAGGRRADDDRRCAAEDRRHAAADREHARADREQLNGALSDAQFDDLTGTYRRATGTLALQAEVDRAHRTDGRLVLAFVDVDALKAHNDREGHASGDQLLVDVVVSIRSQLRAYDPIVRFGGDEFVCALCGADLAGARRRFDGIDAALERISHGSAISVGFGVLQAGDTLDDLVRRGDAALYEAKQHH